MLEFLGTGIIGSIFGGLFRLAPEVLKFFDKKNERMHELSMFTLQTDLEKMRGEFRVEERYVDHSVSQLEAIKEAFVEQRKTSQASYKWVAALSALVRPIITYILFLLYVTFKISVMYMAYTTGVPWLEIIQNSWTVEDFGLLNMILTFWFVGRSIEKYEKTTR